MSVDSVTPVTVGVANAVDVDVTVNVVVDVYLNAYIVGVFISNERVVVTYDDTNAVNSTDANTAIP